MPAWFWTVLKVLVTALALGYVGIRLWHDRESVGLAVAGLDGGSVGWLALGLVGVALNWGLEAQKWRILVRPFYPGVTLGMAVKAVLTGMATGIWTPNRVGEYAGRVLILPSGRRTEAVMVTFVDRLCQMGATLTFGLAALVVLSGGDRVSLAEAWLGDPAWAKAFWAVGLILLVATWTVVWFPVILIRPLTWVFRGHEWGKHLENALKHLPAGRIRSVVLLSALRYMVFSVQYFCLLKAFHVEGSAEELFPLIAMVFLAKSVVPVLAFMELGVREVVAISVFGLVGIGAGQVVSATFVLYVLNILLPSVMGAFFVREIKLREGDGV